MWITFESAFDELVKEARTYFLGAVLASRPSLPLILFRAILLSILPPLGHWFLLQVEEGELI